METSQTRARAFPITLTASFVPSAAASPQQAPSWNEGGARHGFPVYEAALGVVGGGPPAHAGGRRAVVREIRNMDLGSRNNQKARMPRARSSAAVDGKEALRVAQPGAGVPHGPHLVGLERFWTRSWPGGAVCPGVSAMGRMGPMGRMGQGAGGIAVPGGVHVLALPGSMGQGSTGGWGSQEEASSCKLQASSPEEAASYELRARRRRSHKPRRICEPRAGKKLRAASLKLQATKPEVHAPGLGRSSLDPSPCPRCWAWRPHCFARCVWLHCATWWSGRGSVWSRGKP